MLKEDEDVSLHLVRRKEVHFLATNPVQITHANSYGFSVANGGARMCSTAGTG